MDRVVKGIVMEINKNYAIMMTGDGEFLKVKKPSHEIFSGEEITSTVLKDKHKNNVFIYAAVAALIMLLVLPLSYIKQAYATVAYVNVDINPSLEFGVNKFNKVNTISPLNKDAEDLLKDMPLTGLDIKDALDKVIATAKDMGYIKDADENNIEIALVPVKDTDINITQDRLMGYAEDSLKKLDVGAAVKIQEADKKIHDDAAKENMSTNKYMDKEKIDDKNSIKKDIEKSKPAVDDPSKDNGNKDTNTGNDKAQGNNGINKDDDKRDVQKNDSPAVKDSGSKEDNSYNGNSKNDKDKDNGKGKDKDKESHDKD